MILFRILSCFFLYFSEAGALVLTIAPGTRAVAMGSAFTAVADDATASYFNPAGLAFQNEYSFIAMNSVFQPGLAQVISKGLFEKSVPRGPAWLPGFYPDMRYLYLGGVMPITESTSFGYSYTYLTTGRFEARDENGDPIGTFETYDYALIVSYGSRIETGLGIGISFKYIRSIIVPNMMWHNYGRKGNAYAFDGGILWREGDSGFSVGVSCQNINFGGIKYSWSGNVDPLPKLYRIGVSYKFVFPGRYLNSNDRTDYTFSFDRISDLVGINHESWWCWGMEVGLNNILAVRGGFFIDNKGSRKGYTYGCGIRVGSVDVSVANDANIYDFPTENLRFQIGVKSLEWYEKVPNPVIAGLSSVIIPGAGQFYNGDGLKGFILTTVAFSMGEIFYGSIDDESLGTTEFILSAVHLVSIVDAVYAANSKRKSNK